jgi:hypothetical protein
MANTTPIYSKEGNISWATLDTANTAKDGTGTVATVFTADATNGSMIEKVVAEALGTNASSTVLRIFLNNGSTNTTAANNTLIKQISLPATTLSETSGQAPIIVYLKMAIPAGYKINVTIGTSVSAGWAVAGIGGNY